MEEVDWFDMVDASTWHITYIATWNCNAFHKASVMLMRVGGMIYAVLAT